MEQQQIYQLKLAALQGAAGNLGQAQEIYDWLTLEVRQAEEAKAAQTKAQSVE